LRGLLDVNVLVALAWPSHIHHARAHSWFSRHGKAGWSTCPATQAGFARVVSNPSFSSDALTPREALAYLGRITGLPGHAFWADDHSLVGSRWLAPERLVGYRQVTDAHLLAIALRHRGALVTFDRGARALVPAGLAADVVQVLAEP
jgi:toxin-antitoxin system PIN domain toxin